MVASLSGASVSAVHDRPGLLVDAMISQLRIHLTEPLVGTFAALTLESTRNGHCGS